MAVLQKHISSIYLVIFSVISLYTQCHSQKNLDSVSKNPEQIHLSFGSQANDINIVWSTKVNEEGYVEYGSDVNDLTSFIKVKSIDIELKSFSENAARFIHKVELSKLDFGVLYWYVIFSAISGTQSEKYTFTVPHGNLSKFVVLADVGVRTQSLPFLVREVLNGHYDVVFHIGDIAYELGRDKGSVGDQFMNKIADFTARVPYMTTPGDHEKSNHFYHYRHRFSMPNAPWPMTEDSLWYSINIGLTHFISINTQLVPPDKLSYKQLEWLITDLNAANKNRQAVPWIIVMGHKPMYCTKSVMEQYCDRERSPLRDQLEDLLFAHGVDLYISGHKHCYERSWPMYRGRVFQTDNYNPMAPIYIITGTTGYQYLVDEQYSRPFWLASAVSDGQKELYARLTVVNATHLIWSMHAVNSNEEIENVQIIQNNHGSFGKAGSSAFSKIKFATNKDSDLPPEPFFLVDIQPDNYSRRFVLYSTVIVLSLILVLFFRNAKMRKVLQLKM